MRPPRPLSHPEFIALMATMMAFVAFSVDAMLPALPRIASELSPDAPNNAQLILTAFVMGMGIGTLFAGPISDSTGRKATIMAGVALYVLGATAAAFAPTLEWMLAARLVQGLGAAAPRIVSTAMIRDQFAGRRMAQIMSFVMMIFILIPAIAPFVGMLVIDRFGWRAIFGVFVGFGLIAASWMALRQPETLPPSARRPLRPAELRAAFGEVVGNPMVRLYIAVLTLGFGQMFALLSSIQQLLSDTFGLGESFPAWFMAIALLSGAGTIVNARLVMRLGMRRLAITSYATQTVVSGLFLAASLGGLVTGPLAFPMFFAWAVSVFFMAGLTFGNINALALEPLGHIAGMAASVVGAVATVLAVLIAAPIGLAFDGSPEPLLLGTLICSAIAWWLMRRARAGDPAPRRAVPEP